MDSRAAPAIPILAIALGMLQAACAERPADDARTEAPVSCEAVLCRPAGIVNMQLENGEPYAIEIDAPTPYVHDDVVTLLPGDTLFIEGDMEGNRLVNLHAVRHAVREVRDPSQTLMLSFRQAGSGMTMLTIENGLPRAVKFHAKMRIPGHEGWRETSTCSVGPNGFQSFESWPHPISGLMIADFRLAGENAEDAGPCVY